MAVKHYIFKNGAVLQVGLLDWCVFMGCHDRHLAETIVGPIRVSTVFLGLNHRYSFQEGPPILWETMLFHNEWLKRQDIHAPQPELPAELDDYQTRYDSPVQAMRGHLIAVDKAMEFFPDALATNIPHQCGAFLSERAAKAEEIRANWKATPFD